MAAYTSLLQPKLAPVDTVHAIMATDGGCTGSFHVSFGTEFKSAFEVEVVTTNGAVTLTPTQVRTSRRAAESGSGGGDRIEEKEDFAYSAGVKIELEAFYASVQKGVVDDRASPEQALADLTILQAMLDSGDEKGAVKNIAA